MPEDRRLEVHIIKQTAKAWLVWNWILQLETGCEDQAWDTSVAELSSRGFYRNGDLVLTELAGSL